MPPRHAKINLHAAPQDHLVANHKWPAGRLKRNPPGEAKLMRALAIRLINATQGMSLREIEAKSGISISTISKIKRGEAWPTMVAIAHLERTLHIRLWGDEHHIPPPPP